jgi:hypothetical protein
MSGEAEPTLRDIMALLQGVVTNVNDLAQRMSIQEDALADIQPRVSILFDQEDKHESKLSSEEGSVSGDARREQLPTVVADGRKSMFQKKVEEASALADRHTVVIQRPTPSHSHIYLQSTELGEYANFVNKWFDWEIQHGIKLEPALIVARSVRNQLMYNNGKTETDFNELTPATFCSMMAKETKVFSKVQFAETLKNAMRDVKLLYWDNVRPSSHEKFFQGILRRQKLFLKTFQIMMEANKQYCPELEGKEFGLAQIFLDSIDKNYNKYILAEIPKVKEYNYKKLENFLDAYVAKAKEHFEASRSIRSVPYSGQDFKAGNQKTFNNFRATNNKANYEPKGYQYQQQQVNFVDVTVENDDDEEERKGQLTDEQTNGEVSDNESQVASSKMDQHSEEVGDDESYQHVDQPHELNAVEHSHSATPSVRGCVNYALYGKCFGGDACKNVQGHNEKVAKETRQWILRKVTTPVEYIKPSRNPTVADTSTSQWSRQANASRSNFPTKIVQRDKNSNRNVE